MIKARLERESTGEEGTFGRLIFPHYSCFTLELPWRGNAKNISCIPPGVYNCFFSRMSRTVGGRRELYRIWEVPDRSGIFFHAGNWAGDRSQGYKSDSLGCPLLGRQRGILAKQRAILGSQTAVAEMLEYLEKQDFELTIVEEG